MIDMPDVCERAMRGANYMAQYVVPDRREAGYSFENMQEEIDVMTAMILEILMPKYLLEYFRAQYPDVDDDLKSKAVLKTLQKIWFDPHRKAELSAVLERVCSETAHLNLLGVFTFRLSELQRGWIYELDRITEDLIFCACYGKLVDFLRDYISSWEHQPAEVYILLQPDGLQITWLGGEKTVHQVLREDQIFLALLKTLPKRIYLDKRIGEAFKSFYWIVNRVFAQQITIIDF